MDSAGNFYFADLDNAVIRMIGGPAQLSFGSVSIDSTSTQQDLSITNSGNAPLTFAALTLPTDFNISGTDTTCTGSTSLAPGQSCVLGIVFAPTATGELGETLSLVNNLGSQSIVLFGIGLEAATTTTVSGAPDPATIGQSVTLTATVSPAPSGSPLGSIAFQDGATLLGTVNLDSSGAASFTSSSLTLGAHSIIAVYSGNTNFLTSTSSVATETINALPTATSTALTALPNPATFGQTVTFTATVTPAPTGSPLGNVIFCDGGTIGPSAVERLMPNVPAGNGLTPPRITPDTPAPCGSGTLLGTITVSSSGIAIFTTTSLSVAAHSITAIYIGNAGFARSTSNAVAETVNSAISATTITLSGAPNPATAGESVTLTATVTPTPTGSPLGSVSFFSGGALIGTENLNSSGVATFLITSLSVGADTLTAVYSGNTGFATSTSSSVTETVSGTTTTATSTALTAAPNPASAGQAVAFTATISPAPTGTSLGTVSFYEGATLLGTGTVNSSGAATLSISSLASGSDSITAVYSGNTAFGGSTSSALSETIDAAYIVTAPAVPVTAAEGGSVAIPVTVPPLGGSFNSVVTMSASGLPPGATATFNPPTVTPGINGAATTLTIHLLSATTARGPADRQQRTPFAPMGAAVALFCIALGYTRSTRQILKRSFLLAGFCLAGAFLIGCNGGFAGKPGTLPGSYTITITGTSGALSRSTTVTLVVP
jgi:hypothetical protein